MSLDVKGIDASVEGKLVELRIDNTHPLLKLSNKIPWMDLLSIVLSDLKKTEKGCWWRGRPLKVRIHLGIYLLQQMFDLTDRQAEYSLRDNGAFQLFCGSGIIDNWHAPDHTKIESFRSRLSPETQRALANIITKHASNLNYTNPTQIDVDSTVQEANITPPSKSNLLLHIMRIAKRVAHALNDFNLDKKRSYKISPGRVRFQLDCYFAAKKSQSNKEVNKRISPLPYLQAAWREASEQLVPVLKDSYQLLEVCGLRKYHHLKRNIEKLTWRAQTVLNEIYLSAFEGQPRRKHYSLDMTQVECFRKNNLNKAKYGRAYQIVRVAGNFAFVPQCRSIRMPDSESLSQTILEYENGQVALIKSVAVDRGYYSQKNERLLSVKCDEYHLPRRRNKNETTHPKLPMNTTQVKLHCRRAGIEAIIGHIKHGGQLGRSRMKSDNTTLAAGYASVLGFNLRQLKRYASGVVCLNDKKGCKIA